MYPYPYPETSLTLGTPRDKPYHPGTLHFTRPPHGPGTYHIVQYTTYPSGGHHMAKETTPVSPAYPTFTSRAYPAMHKVTMRQDCKSASQNRRALCPRDTARHISKKSANQQNNRVRVFILQEQIKVAMAWVPADPPVSWMAISTLC